MSKRKLPKAIRRSTADVQGATEETDATAVPDFGLVGRVVEVAPSEEAASPRDADARATPAPAPAGSDSVERRARACMVVERHAAYSAVGGLIPLPIANVAGLTAIIIRMVRVLSDLYGVPFERDRARAIVIGLMGGAMPTGLAAAAASLIYVVPGSNLIGLAVSSVAAIACTRGIGRVFVEHFESGAPSVEVPALERR